MTETTTDVPDRYEREVTLAAPRDQIWAAITEPDQLKRWFAEASLPVRPGGSGFLRFANQSAADDIDPVLVVAVEPPHRFAFRWRSYPDDPDLPLDALPSTLVEFTLTETSGGTVLRIVESGFAALPEALRAQSLRDNTGGWDEALRDLAAYLARA